MKYFSYRRVSKKEKDTGSVSLDWQAAEIKRWCEKRNVDLSGDFKDDGVSAQKPLRRRKEGRALMQAAAVGDCTVIVAKVDRIFRDTEDFLTTVNEWARKHVTLVSVNDHLDLVSPTGEFMATVMAAVHRWERRTIGERVKTRCLQRKQTGMRYLRDAPYGFRFEGETIDENGRKSGGTLVKDVIEQTVIQKILHWRSDGWTLREIAKELDLHGHKPRRGTRWPHTTVKKILETAKARQSKKKRGDGNGHAAPDLTLHLDPKDKDGVE